MQGLSQIVEAGEAQRLAAGFTFTEGPLWHPDGFYYFVDQRASPLYRMTPGGTPELLREETRGGSALTFGLQGQLVICEGEGRSLSRLNADGQVVEAVVERFEGKR